MEKRVDRIELMAMNFVCHPVETHVRNAWGTRIQNASESGNDRGYEAFLMDAYATETIDSREGKS